MWKTHRIMDTDTGNYYCACGICGQRVRRDNMTVDHIKPVSLGGTDCPDNLRPAHAECNNLRGNTYP